MTDDKRVDLGEDQADLAVQAKLRATRAVLGYREQELLALKGPCSSSACRLHHAHSGPCDTAAAAGESAADQPQPGHLCSPRPGSCAMCGEAAR